MQKSMDLKLQDIRANASSKEFIICYAADPDMGAGMAPLVGLYPSLRAYHESLAGLIEQAKLDIMLTSTSAGTGIGFFATRDIPSSRYATIQSTSPPTREARALRSVMTPRDVDTMATPSPFITGGISSEPL